jgi:hypothetical protein
LAEEAKRRRIGCVRNCGKRREPIEDAAILSQDRPCLLGRLGDALSGRACVGRPPVGQVQPR